MPHPDEDPYHTPAHQRARRPLHPAARSAVERATAGLQDAIRDERDGGQFSLDTDDLNARLQAYKWAQAPRSPRTPMTASPMTRVSHLSHATRASRHSHSAPPDPLASPFRTRGHSRMPSHGATPRHVAETLGPLDSISAYNPPRRGGGTDRDGDGRRSRGRSPSPAALSAAPRSLAAHSRSHSRSRSRSHSRSVTPQTRQHVHSLSRVASSSSSSASGSTGTTHYERFIEEDYTDEADHSPETPHGLEYHSMKAHRKALLAAQAEREARAADAQAERDGATAAALAEQVRAALQLAETNTRLQAAEDALRVLQAKLVAEKLRTGEVERRAAMEAAKREADRQELAVAVSILRRAKDDGKRSEEERRRLLRAFDEAKARLVKYHEEIRVRDARKVAHEEGRTEAFAEAGRWMGINPPLPMQFTTAPVVATTAAAGAPAPRTAVSQPNDFSLSPLGVHSHPPGGGGSAAQQFRQQVQAIPSVRQTPLQGQQAQQAPQAQVPLQQHGPPVPPLPHQLQQQRQQRGPQQAQQTRQMPQQAQQFVQPQQQQQQFAQPQQQQQQFAQQQQFQQPQPQQQAQSQPAPGLSPPTGLAQVAQNYIDQLVAAEKSAASAQPTLPRGPLSAHAPSTHAPTQIYVPTQPQTQAYVPTQPSAPRTMQAQAYPTSAAAAPSVPPPAGPLQPIPVPAPSHPQRSQRSVISVDTRSVQLPDARVPQAAARTAPSYAALSLLSRAPLATGPPTHRSQRSIAEINKPLPDPRTHTRSVSQPPELGSAAIVGNRDGPHNDSKYPAWDGPDPNFDDPEVMMVKAIKEQARRVARSYQGGSDDLTHAAAVQLPSSAESEYSARKAASRLGEVRDDLSRISEEPPTPARSRSRAGQMTRSPRPIPALGISVGGVAPELTVQNYHRAPTITVQPPSSTKTRTPLESRRMSDATAAPLTRDPSRAPSPAPTSQPARPSRLPSRVPSPAPPSMPARSRATSHAPSRVPSPAPPSRPSRAPSQAFTPAPMYAPSPIYAASTGYAARVPLPSSHGTAYTAMPPSQHSRARTSGGSYAPSRYARSHRSLRSRVETCSDEDDDEPRPRSILKNRSEPPLIDPYTVPLPPSAGTRYTHSRY